ncbi:thermonuclease family protein [Enterococcus sp. AZ126]|uniref:thermonuclease family protein n=1 Tax=Enterococcus sp. AZ126 TaxID=2774635 RepID=UPI003F225636
MYKKRKTIRKIILLIIFLFGSGFQFIHSNLPSNKLDSIENTDQKETIHSVSLSRLIDGDTTEFLIDGKKTKVRYLLIDTPETKKPGTPIQPFGLDASNRTKELLQQAQSIELKEDPNNSTDKYGRSLAYVYVDGELLQKILVREGLARVAYAQSSSDKGILDSLLTEERQAKTEKIGIWSIDGYVTDKGFKP